MERLNDVPRPESLGITAKSSKVTSSWYSCGLSPPEISQGWKLYISASLVNFTSIVPVVAPIFASRRVPFKYLSSTKELRKLNAGFRGYSQIGKCIVAYVAGCDDIPGLIKQLKESLIPFLDSSPKVPYAASLGAGWPIYYRYGSYSGALIDFEERAVTDDRADINQSQRVASGDPFLQFVEPEQTDTKLASVLQHFPIFKPIAQGGKGGIYAALDISSATYSEVAVKIGIRNGQILPDGRDGHVLLKYEWKMYQAFKEGGACHYLPTLIQFEETAQNCIMIMERLEGPDLNQLRREGNLTVDMLKKSIRILNGIHRAGFFAGDAKLANFVRTQQEEVRFVDLECAGYLRGGVADVLQTYILSNPRISDLAILDYAHLLVSALLRFEDRDPYTMKSRYVDIQELIWSTVPRNDPERFALRCLRKIHARWSNGAAPQPLSASS